MTWQGRRRARDGHDPARWQPAVRSKSQMQRRACGLNHTRVGTWHWWPRGETASWHRPCATGAPLGTSATWCRSCKVGVKMLTHTAPPGFAAAVEVTQCRARHSTATQGLRHVSSADNWSNRSGILNVPVCGMWRLSEANGSQFGDHKHTATFPALHAVLSCFTLRFCWLKF